MGLFTFFQKDPIAELEKEITGLGHADYPFLHPTYNPMNRIPCTDFSFWVRERLHKKDYKSIDYLFFKIIEANPGIAVSLGGDAKSALSSHWACRLKKIYDADLTKVIKYNNNCAYLDLRTLLILDLPHSDKDRVTYFISCMSPFIPERVPIKNPSIISPLGEILSKLPLSSRSHFFDICKLYNLKKTRSMPCEKSSFYSTRQRGISLKNSCEQLVAAGLICVDISAKNAINQYTKEELVSFAEKRKIQLSSVWKKEKMIDFILEHDPMGAKVLAEKYQLVYPSQKSIDYYTEFLELASQMRVLYEKLIPYVN